jgi:hypothetical protein
MAAGNKCSDCGKDRELPQYANDSCCRACRSKRNKLIRAGKMAAKGKRPQGSGRSPNCSKCGALKDPSFMTSGYCRACKSEANALKRLNARLDRGQRPLGEGRKIYCYECGKVKENIKNGYCHACDAARDRERRMHFKQTPGFAEREREKVNNRVKNDLIFKIKKDIHLLTNAATRLGILDRQPCEVCGEMKVDAHHDDYNKPMEVRWLCRLHHNEHHRLHGEAILPHALIEILKERNLL